MLDAARQLFEDVGYEAATIRDIARRADVSVGSVFTGFASKSHVLVEVIGSRLDELYADLERVAPHLRGSTADRIRSLFAVHYAFEFRRLRLFLAHISVAFEWRETPDLPVLGTNRRLRGMIRDCLAEGAARGDVRADVDLELLIDLLIGAYVWNYRFAAADRADAERLTALFDRQVGMIFEGLTPAR
ncbi:MAG TPA: helix-turn-helix domain-containing protein [Caulobacteraceae bacterium]|nr:helix-turn-helix domain-containing protein [Caulobacteraceae bacterium]